MLIRHAFIVTIIAAAALAGCKKADQAPAPAVDNSPATTAPQTTSPMAPATPDSSPTTPAQPGSGSASTGS
ncbi:hypothetical protein ACIPF8_05025 [Collimonas sp. NPDC087041]|uniref:hypothetical protein n=1 Tax=Collimonas sp. NPDC087041 TaxID=3363960 RepID=UPI0038076C15